MITAIARAGRRHAGGLLALALVIGVLAVGLASVHDQVGSQPTVTWLFDASPTSSGSTDSRPGGEVPPAHAAAGRPVRLPTGRCWASAAESPPRSASTRRWCGSSSPWRPRSAGPAWPSTPRRRSPSRARRGDGHPRRRAPDRHRDHDPGGRGAAPDRPGGAAAAAGAALARRRDTGRHRDRRPHRWRRPRARPAPAVGAAGDDRGAPRRRRARPDRRRRRRPGRAGRRLHLRGADRGGGRRGRRGRGAARRAATGRARPKRRTSAPSASAPTSARPWPRGCTTPSCRPSRSSSAPTTRGRPAARPAPGARAARLALRRGARRTARPRSRRRCDAGGRGGGALR